jgi:CO/xanthine dehydrogenase FAD-binding subunit
MPKLIPTATRYDRPDTPEALHQLIKNTTVKPFLMAGGTSLAFSRPKAEHIIDLNRLPFRECRLTAQHDLEIGALTTIGDLERLSEIQSFCGGILLQATDKLASTPLRNLITVGGNLAAGYPWSDLPVACLALNARLRFFDPAQTDYVSPEETALPHNGKTSFRKLTANQLVSHIILDGKYSNARGAFTKFSRTSTDLAIITVAITFIPDGNLMRSVRVAVGGLVSVPQRLPDVEMLLEGQTFEKTVLLNAGAAADVMLRNDTRASDDYRRSVLKTLVTRTFMKATGVVDDEN